MRYFLLTLAISVISCTFPLEVEQVKFSTNTVASGVKVKCKLGREACVEEIIKSCHSEKYYLINEKSYSAGLDDKESGSVPWYTMLVGCGDPPEGFTPIQMAMPSVIEDSAKRLSRE